MYKHKQTGWVIIISISASIILLSVVYFQVIHLPSIWIVRIVMLIVLAALLLFYSLSVTVDDKEIEIKFGVGLIKKRIEISSVASCEIVKNKWWYGWGIRYVPGSGWMYNVSGLDAVQLHFKEGKNFRIGTDEPEKLAEFIRNRIS